MTLEEIKRHEASLMAFDFSVRLDSQKGLPSALNKERHLSRGVAFLGSLILVAFN